MNSLFGVELPATVTFVIAFVIVLALIGAAAWLVRRFGAARLGAGRGRQPRLAVIDAAAVDGRRKLVIIRRDNVEHLLMIGGPTDVVVETNILRAAAATQREPAPARADTLPRAVPLPDTVNWPPAPEPAAAPRTERPRMLVEEPAPIVPPPMQTPPPMAPTPMAPAPIMSMRAAPEPRPQPATDPLIGLAAELSRVKTESLPRAPEPPRVPAAPSFTNSDVPLAPAAPAVAAAPPAPPIAVSADAHLAEMAQRLESALRRPIAGSQGPRSESLQRPTAAAEPKRLEPKTSLYGEQPPSPAANGPSNGNGAPARSIYEDLEQEMASLLGRQSGKT